MLNGSSLLKWAGALVGLVLAVALVANSCRSDRRVQQALAAKESADSARKVADEMLAVAKHDYENQKAAVKIIRKIDTLIQEKEVKVLGTVVPDTCIQYVAPLRALVLEQHDQIGKWRGAWDSLSAVTDSVLTVAATLKTSNDSLSRAYRLLLPRHYDLLGRLFHPEIKPAVFVGGCTNGKPCAGAGVAIVF